MTDTPTPPGDDGPTGEPDVADPAAADDAKPWYSQPLTWIIAGAAVILVVVLIVVASSGDDDTETSDDGLSSSPTETVPPETTAPPETTGAPETTAPPATDPPATDPPATDPPATDPPTTDPPDPGPEPVVVEASPVNAVLEQAGYAALPWDDDVEVTAHWYTWEDEFVVVYAGWEASEDAPLCPGNSLQTASGFDFISNSPSHDGGCDPEDEFLLLVPEDDDDESGARVCGSLVLYRTIIPTTDGGTAWEGNLFGSVEQALGDGVFNGATSAALIADGIGELDPTADAYSVPDGWLPGGETEVVC